MLTDTSTRYGLRITLVDGSERLADMWSSDFLAMDELCRMVEGEPGVRRADVVVRECE